MKKIIAYTFIFFLFGLSACIKNDLKTWQGKLAEVDAASWNANAAGLTYPILTRVVPDNRTISTTADSTLRRWSRTTRVRVNLVGAQSGQDETVGYKVFGTPAGITSVAFPATLLFTSAPGTPGRQEPAQPAATLSVSDAIVGTDYTALSGKVTIPKGSSFGYIDIQILNAGATAGQSRFLGIRLDSTGTLMPSVNYNTTGLIIDQR
jgi:hypothetical protein